MMYTLTQFMLLTTMVLVLFTAGAALTHVRVERLALRLVVTIGARVGDWAYGVHADVWEAVHTSDWTPGRLGKQWMRFVNAVEKRSSALAIAANQRLQAITPGSAWDDEGTFVEAD